MKISLPILSALMLAFLATTAMAESPAQMQQDRQACQNDVYTFCNDAIPDHDRIAACLKKHWREISPACRETMTDHGHKRRRHHVR